MKKIFPIVLGSICAVLLAASPANAQYLWGYSPYTGSANWLGFANFLRYPFYRYSTVAAPFYLASPLMYSGSYFASQALGNGYRQSYYGSYYNNGVVDQIAHNPPYGVNAPVAPPAPSPPLPQAAPQPVSAPSASQASAVPPLAPSFQSAPAAIAHFDPYLHNSPMAQGFIDLVNGKYGGDITKALFDPATRSYARSIGLVKSEEVFNADLSPHKVETIRSIFSDQKEDASQRVAAVRMLLTH